ncbi:MAG: DUF4352 domain-containing protein, partial [Actinomadura sp.]
PTAPPPAPMGPPPRQPPTQPPLILPAYAGARRPRRRSRLLGCSVTAVILFSAVIAVLVVLAAVTSPTDGRLGRPAKDGQFTFVVQNPIRCGRNATIPGMASSAGKLCLVRFKVENTGTKNRALTSEWQKLLDSADAEMAGVKLLEGTTPRARNEVGVRVLKPGQTFTGFVIFDVPVAYQPTAVVLHDAGPSRGVRIPST